MTSHEVVIVGAGPTGLMLAGELALAQVDVGIVERRPTQDLAGSRAGGLHARTIEVFDQRGIAERFLAEGQTVQVAQFAGARLDISDFPTRHGYGLGLWQNHIERILAEWVDELEVPVHRDRKVLGFVQDPLGVDVELSDGSSLRADYLVGCDGGRSIVRKTAGIEFPGWDPTTSNLIAEVELADEPDWGIRHDARGIHAISRVDYDIVDGEVVYRDTGPIRVMVTEGHVGSPGTPTLQDLSNGLIAVYGTDYGVHNPTWISRFSDTTRQAAAYRDRRVMLAGDAAHVHSPVGGQGLNIGVQDAMNLGWKLAQVVKGTSHERLLDTYHAERHPIASRVLRTTMAGVALQRRDARVEAVSETIAELLAMDEPRKRFAAMMSGLDVHYDLGDGHPLLGRRIPDLDIATADGPSRVFELLHEARPVLLQLADPPLDISGWADRVQFIRAGHSGMWELPVLGEIPAPTAVLVRPDGHVAWVGEGTDDGLAQVLTTWFGEPRSTAPVPFSIAKPEQLEWTTRPHEPGEPARHVSELQELFGFEHTRANVWRYEPGAAGRRHVHADQEETFVVLTGTLTMHLGDPPERHVVSAGGLIHVKPGTPLQTVNEGDEDLLVFAYGSPPDDGAGVLPSVV